MDVLNKEQRHQNTKNIKSKNTKIEVKLCKALWNNGYKYRKNYKKLPGEPDIVLTKYKIAIFCDGEFFHGQSWKKQKARLQKSNNSEFWINNIEIDSEVDKQLSYLGWAVLSFFGKDILKNTDECIKMIDDTIFKLMI